MHACMQLALSGGYCHVMCVTLGGNITRRRRTRGSTSGSHCASLSLLALFLSQAFSLVSFSFTNLFLALSLFLLVDLLKCRTAGKRQTGITGSVTYRRRSHDLYTVWSTG